MRQRATALIFTTTAIMALTGCAAGATTETLEESPAASVAPESAGATTIDDVWEKIGCKESDPLGTGGRIQTEDPTDKYGLARAGSCKPIENGELVFFYEAPDADALDAYLTAGYPELGATDALFRDGSVAILAQDAAAAKMIAEFAEPVDR